MRKLNLNLTLGALLALGGCGQIIGLGDYDIDPKLGAAGTATTDGGDDSTGNGGKANTGGKANGGTNNTPGGDGPIKGGDTNLPQGGDTNLPQAGAAPVGGDTGAAGGPGTELIPCTTAACCTQMGGKAVGVEILVDGGFEGGPVDEGNTAWTEESTNDLEIITPTDLDGTGLGFKAHAGEYYAYLSGLAGETSTVYSPDFTVPNDAGWMTLSGYRLFQVDTQDGINEDFCGIALYDPTETDPAELPFFWGDPATGHTDGWADSPGWKRFEKSWDATPHQGGTRYVGFRGSSDEYSTDVDLDSSSYLMDDVSLKIYRCYK